jgi:hypothetical protein
VKLLLDQNLSPRLARALSAVCPGSTHVGDVGLQAAGDDTVWANALKQRRALTAPPLSGQHWVSAARAAAPCQVNLKAAAVGAGAESYADERHAERVKPGGHDLPRLTGLRWAAVLQNLEDEEVPHRSPAMPYDDQRKAQGQARQPMGTPRLNRRP